MKTTLPKIGYKYVSLSLMSALLVGCASANPNGLGSDANWPSVKTFLESDLSPNDEAKYVSSKALSNVFKVGDIAKVTVHGFEEFSGAFSLDSNGQIYFAYIGLVTVSGKTVAELQNHLREEYAACCLRSPSVSVEKESEAIGKIVVDGAVESPGSFDVFESIRLSEAIAIAGGAGQYAAKSRTILSRDFDGERRIMVLDLEAIQLHGGNDPKLYPGDVIFIEDNQGKLLFENFVKTIPLLSAVIFAVTR